LYLDCSKQRITDETLKLLLDLAAECDLRGRIDAMFRGDKINVTEQRAAFGPIANATALARELDTRTGIVEHGLFLGLATDLLVATDQGVKHKTRSLDWHLSESTTVEA
jgi:glucose-6-phosphate isomerase